MLLLRDRPAPPRDDLSRRRFVTGAALAALLAGCATPAPTEPAAGPSGGFPRTLPGKEGAATIPRLPERVVAIGYQRDGDTALALRVAPVAVAASAFGTDGFAPWTAPVLGQPRPETLDVQAELPFERIAALRPDLILATDDYGLAQNLVRLAEIAPTLSYLAGPEADTWQQRTRHVGAAVGRAEQAERLVADVEATIDRTAAANPALAGRTFTRSIVIEGEIYTVVGDVSTELFERLGLVLAPAVTALPQSATPGRALVALENLAVLDADVAMISFFGDGQQEFLESLPLFAQLGWVRDARYVPLDVGLAASLTFLSPLSIPYGLDRLVPAVAAVPGRPHR